jgi:hypothetical protein
MLPPKLTLLEYAAARGFDPATLARAVKAARLPEPAGLRDGQDIYPVAELDAALDVTGQDMTPAEYAARRGLTGDVARTVKRAGVEPVGGRDGQPLYPGPELDRVFGYVPGAVTLDGLASELGVSRSTVKETWRKTYKHLWPEPVGKRGKEKLFDRQEMEPVVRAARNLPPVQGAPGDLMTWEQVCEYLKPVTPKSTMAWRKSRKTWPAGVIGSDGVERWRRADVDRAQAKLAGRGKGPAAG